MLAAAVSQPSELNNAIEKARVAKSLIPANKKLLEQATIMLDAELNTLVNKLKAAAAAHPEDYTSVERLVQEVKDAGLHKAFIARPGVRDALSKAKEAKARRARTEMVLKQQLAASAKQALKQRESTSATLRESGDKPVQRETEKLVASTEIVDESVTASWARPMDVDAPIAPEEAPIDLKLKTTSAKRPHKHVARAAIGDGSGRESMEQGAAGTSRMNGTRAAASEETDEAITLSYHENPHTPGMSRLDSVLTRNSSMLDPNASSYAQVAGVQKSRFVNTQGSTLSQDEEDAPSQGPPWPMSDPSAATPSSWVQACAAARAEHESLLKTSDSPSEDAFIQSIFRGLDLDDDIPGQ